MINCLLHPELRHWLSAMKRKCGRPILELIIWSPFIPKKAVGNDGKSKAVSASYGSCRFCDWVGNIWSPADLSHIAGYDKGRTRGLRERSPERCEKLL